MRTRLFCWPSRKLSPSCPADDPAPLAAFVDTVNGWLHARLTAGGQSVARLAQLAEVWEKINTAARDAETFNLERKPLVFDVFGWLAEVSRR